MKIIIILSLFSNILNLMYKRTQNSISVPIRDVSFYVKKNKLDFLKLNESTLTIDEENSKFYIRNKEKTEFALFSRYSLEMEKERRILFPDESDLMRNIDEKISEVKILLKDKNSQFEKSKANIKEIDERIKIINVIIERILSENKDLDNLEKYFKKEKIEINYKQEEYRISHLIKKEIDDILKKLKFLETVKSTILVKLKFKQELTSEDEDRIIEFCDMFNKDWIELTFDRLIVDLESDKNKKYLANIKFLDDLGIYEIEILFGENKINFHILKANFEKIYNLFEKSFEIVTKSALSINICSNDILNKN